MQSQSLKQRALHYSTDNESIPKPFMKLLNKQKQKQNNQWNRYKEGKFSTPQNILTSPSKKAIFTPSNQFTVPKKLFFPSTPTNSKFDEQNIPPQIMIAENPVNDFKVDLSEEIQQLDNQQPIEVQQENEIQQEPSQHEQINHQIIEDNNITKQSINQLKNQINEEIKQFSITIQQRVVELQQLKNVHTQQFIKLQYQCHELLEQILVLNEIVKIQQKQKILQDLIAYFATVLPELECKLIKELVYQCLELSNKKLKTL